MIWPGTSDPYKRKQTIRLLVITAIIGAVAAGASMGIQQIWDQDNPLRELCVNEKNPTFKIKATLELIVDGQEAEIPAKIGFNQDETCHKTMYTLTDDGTIYAEWIEEYPFEIGHFLWMWDFPLRDMDQSKSKIIVNGKESEHFINHPLQDGYHYRAEFTSKAYDESKDTDFLPPQN